MLMLTAKPIVSPRVKHEIEGLGLSEDFMACRYCCALQRVSFTPSSVIIIIYWKDAIGDDTLLELVREGREKGREGSIMSGSEMTEIK